MPESSSGSSFPALRLTGFDNNPCCSKHEVGRTWKRGLERFGVYEAGHRPFIQGNGTVL